MRNKILVSLGVISAVGLAGGIFAYSYMKIVRNSRPDDSMPAASTPSTKDTGSSGNIAQNQAGLGLSPQTQMTDQLKVSGSAGGAGGQTQNQTSNAPRTISPDDFKQFDQYIKDESPRYMELQNGTGAEAAAGKQLSVNYRGWLTNGQMFDESYDKAKPFVFVPGQHRVILGWEQGVLGMKVGGQRLLIVPPAVGYGNQTVNGIPANSLLVFQIELLAVN